MRTTTNGTPLRRARRKAVRLAATSAMLAATLVGLPTASAVAGSQLLVPSAFPTIQGAIDAASAGDTVVVAPGTYHEHIDFKGKNIEVRSADSPATTTIDADGLTSVVRIHSGETRAATLRGFTITGGLVDVNEIAATLSGGGIDIQDASPTIVGNVITGNLAGSHGGAGIGAIDGAPLIQSNSIVDNHAGAQGGGGGLIVGGDAEVVDNHIVNNSAGVGGGLIVFGDARVSGNVIRDNHAVTNDGGGIRIHEGNLQVVQNLVTGNSANVKGGGVSVYPGVEPSGLRRVIGNTIAGNQAPAGSALAGGLAGVQIVNNLLAGSIACSGPPIAAGTFHHNLVYTSVPPSYSGCASTGGNISADPNFVVPGGTTPDYHLQKGSPAIDAGDPAATAPPIDFSGHGRVTDGDADGTATIDIGAYEAPTLYPAHPAMPYSVWSQPSGVALDGLGAWVDVLVDPATTGSGPPTYVYGHYFGFVNGGGALGLLGLVSSPTGKSVVFGVVEADGTEHTLAVPFNWAAGAAYFPLVQQTGPGAWGAWVLDYSASTWTHVGVLSLPAAWGKLAPASITAVASFGPLAEECSAYAPTDVLFHPPYGFVAGTGSVATLAGNGSGPGDCLPVTSTVAPWIRYQLGV